MASLDYKIKKHTKRIKTHAKLQRIIFNSMSKEKHQAVHVHPSEGKTSGYGTTELGYGTTELGYGTIPNGCRGGDRFVKGTQQIDKKTIN